MRADKERADQGWTNTLPLLAFRALLCSAGWSRRHLRALWTRLSALVRPYRGARVAGPSSLSGGWRRSRNGTSRRQTSSGKVRSQRQTTPAMRPGGHTASRADLVFLAVRRHHLGTRAELDELIAVPPDSSLEQLDYCLRNYIAFASSFMGGLLRLSLSSSTTYLTPSRLQTSSSRNLAHSTMLSSPSCRPRCSPTTPTA